MNKTTSSPENFIQEFIFFVQRIFTIRREDEGEIDTEIIDDARTYALLKARSRQKTYESLKCSNRSQREEPKICMR